MKKEKNINQNENQLDFDEFLDKAEIILVDDARNFDINKWEEDFVKDVEEDDFYNELVKEAKQIKCSSCGKIFDISDYQEDFSFDKYIGYGSIHDEEHIKFRLCCDCFDKVFEIIKPMIKNIEIEEYDATNYFKQINDKKEK